MDKIKETAVDKLRNTKQRIIKIEANIHLSIFITEVCEIHLPYTFKKDIHSLPLTCGSSVQKQLQRAFLGKVCS